MVSLIEKLRSVYGHRVQDAFEGTNLAKAAEKMDFGLYVVRGAYTQDMAKKAMVDVVELLNDISVRKGSRSVDAKGSKLWYRTLQATSGECLCKYEYEAVARHVPHKIKDAPLLEKMTEFVNAHYAEVDRGCEQFFNQILVNVYSRQRDEYVPWHSDQAPLYADYTDIVSISVGAPGLYCYMPNKKSSAPLTQELGKKWSDIRRQSTSEGAHIPVRPA